MSGHSSSNSWTFIIPLAAGLVFVAGEFIHWPPFYVLSVAALIVSVLKAVHHAEVIAEKIGEPYGALVLALAVTIIEVSIIVSLMLEGGPDASGLARD
ncbi:MAG: ionic transporter y4hA, partial [Cyclobacteriaceae bacterium]|nr:ionic transporter y4hA [Cyclobacteriaceae bacterium]